jgi:tyrosyl-tRNA synthetase
VSAALNELLAPIQKAYQDSPEWQEITLKAYPPPAKKQKKVKDKGSRYPGGGKEKEADQTAESTEKAQTLPDRTV